MLDRLGILAADFGVLSLLSVGGGVSALPEMHRTMVEVHGWMTSAQFAQLYALAQAAPGPNMLVVTLLGWQTAGFAGALVTTGAMCLPSCTLTFWVDRLWRSESAVAWRNVLDNGLAAITVGLIAASGVLLARAADINPAATGLTAAATVLTWRTQIHPLWLIAAGALAGIAGLV